MAPNQGDRRRNRAITTDARTDPDTPWLRSFLLELVLDTDEDDEPELFEHHKTNEVRDWPDPDRWKRT